jgi:hypothetical protein
MHQPKPAAISAIAVARRLVVESAAAEAACEPVWRRTRCSGPGPKPMLAIAAARRLVAEIAAAVDARELSLAPPALLRAT